MSVTYRALGSWCDVATLPDGRFVGVHSEAGQVVAQIIGGPVLWITAVPTDHLRYLRCAVSTVGDVAAIGVGADDVAYLVTRLGTDRWGPVFGQNSVGLYWAAGWMPVIQRSSESYSIGPGTWIPFPDHIRGTSQGFRDVLPDGRIVFGDDAHFITLNGITLHKPCTRDGIVVGQINGTDQIEGRTDRWFTAIPGPAYEPHCCTGPGHSHAVCARTPRGAAFLVVPPYPVQEPPPVPQLDIIRAIRAQYPTPLGATHAQLLLDCAAALNMGLLRKTGGTRIALPPPHVEDGQPIEVSQDILMDKATGQIYDFLGDAEGEATPGWSEAVGSPQPLSRLYVPVGSGDDDDPGDTDPPPPDDAWQREIERRLTALEQAKFGLQIVRL